jgi:(p)ppGpp synthase/HD superfamily hydrolase
MAPIVARRMAVEPQDPAAAVALGIKGTEGMVIDYAKCCKPIPGDPIMGFLSAGRGMVIHRENCTNIAEVRRYPEKYVFVQWDSEVTGFFPVEIKVDVLNKKGILATIANTISECNANIETVNVDESDNQHNQLAFLIHVRDKQQLANIIRRLRSISVVMKAERAA